MNWFSFVCGVPELRDFDQSAAAAGTEIQAKCIVCHLTDTELLHIQQHCSQLQMRQQASARLDQHVSVHSSNLSSQ